MFQTVHTVMPWGNLLTLPVRQPDKNNFLNSVGDVSDSTYSDAMGKSINFASKAAGKKQLPQQFFKNCQGISQVRIHKYRLMLVF